MMSNKRKPFEIHMHTHPDHPLYPILEELGITTRVRRYRTRAVRDEAYRNLVHKQKRPSLRDVIEVVDNDQT